MGVDKSVFGLSGISSAVERQFYDIFSKIEGLWFNSKMLQIPLSFPNTYIKKNLKNEQEVPFFNKKEIVKWFSTSN